MGALPIEGFADRVLEVMPVVMREFARRQIREINEGKVTLPQVLVLDYLHAQGTSKMKDLAAELKVTTAAMTGIVDRLVRERYVERCFDERDRRIINIMLTPQGKTLIGKINRGRRQLVMQVFARISPVDREKYLSVLRQIRQIILEQPAG